MKASTSLVALLLMGAALSAQVHVPDPNPTTGSSNGYPWTIHTEWRYQMLVPAALLGGKPFRAVDLAFAPSSTSNFSSPKALISIAHTTASQFSRTFAVNLQSNLTTVFSGALAWAMTSGQWSDVGLTAPFDYNGVDNMVVEVRYASRTGGGSCHTSGGAIQRLYVFGTGAYNATTGASQIDGLGLKMRFTVVSASLSATGSPAPGGTIDFALLAPADAGLRYQLGSSLGTGPIPIDTRLLHLSPDDLLVVTVFGYVPSIFAGYAGTLDGSGGASAKINIPNDTRLKGTRIHTAFVTAQAAAPSGIKSISNTFSFAVQ